MTRDDLLALLESYLLALSAIGRSKNTIQTYRDGVMRFASWCESEGRNPELSKRNVEAFITYLWEKLGQESATRLIRQAALQLFSAWLHAEGEIKKDELYKMKPVKLDEKIVPMLSDEQVKQLLKACGNGKSREFVEIRDHAIIMFMLDTTCRADETVSMDLKEVDILNRTAVVRRGKGGKGRITSFSPATASALDRYKRARRHHRLCERPEFWLGGKGQGFSYRGLYSAIKRRAKQADIELWPHMLRHTAAGLWKASGGSEDGLMAKGGWRDRRMMERYGQSDRSRRAVEETQRLNVMGKFA